MVPASGEDDRSAKDPRPLSPAGIEAQNRFLLRRYRDFRIAADRVTASWRNHPHVLAVSLIGSLARDPWMEVPRFSPYRRAGVAHGLFDRASGIRASAAGLELPGSDGTG